MKIKDFLNKIEYNMYLGCYMYTKVYIDYEFTVPQWIGVETRTEKDENGNDKILKRISENSYYTDNNAYNVMACFQLLGEDTDCYYRSLDNMLKYLQKNLDSGSMQEDDELYVMHGQSINESTELYEITDILYSSDRWGTFIEICTEPIKFSEAVPNIKQHAIKEKMIL